MRGSFSAANIELGTAFYLSICSGLLFPTKATRKKVAVPFFFSLRCLMIATIPPLLSWHLGGSDSGPPAPLFPLPGGKRCLFFFLSSFFGIRSPVSFFFSWDQEIAALFLLRRPVVLSIATERLLSC